MTKEALKNTIATTKNEDIKRMAQAELQKLELQEQAAKGDEVAQTLLLLKETVDTFKRTNQSQGGSGGGTGISKQEVEKMLKGVLQKNKISVEDLDEDLKLALTGNVKTQLTITTPTAIQTPTSAISKAELDRPLFQKVLSDIKARNNVYLFGGAGTGKTYLARQVARYLGWEYIQLSCNQFTSPLDILGGQTIEGYQRGKLEMAWANVDQDGNQLPGVVLCLDELPKIDPNTAGILNDALASIKDFSSGKPPVIRNGRGEALEMKNIFVIATGNTKLNETSVEYEANFKQDLSLQDRFAGSTYEVMVDYRNEFTRIMQGYAFIWLYMTKLREKILEKKWTGFAFVSIRIMENMRDTYKIYREDSKDLTSPKTLQQALDSFLNLFKPNQIELLKNETGYNEFIKIIAQKEKLPLSGLDTNEEIERANLLIKKNEEEQKRKIA